MSINSTQSPQSSATSFVIAQRGILITSVLLALFCFTVLSVSSVRSPLRFISSFSTSTASTSNSSSALSIPSNSSHLSLNKLASPPLATPSPSRPPPRSIQVKSPAVRPDATDVDSSGIYANWELFKLNYADMEKKFKIYIYPDGFEHMAYHSPEKSSGKYASEGFFFQNIRDSQFRTDDPEQADLFFIPVSCLRLRGMGLKYDKIGFKLRDYVKGLIQKYPYWNRTLGSDHFYATCHDVGVRASRAMPNLMKNSIRVVCSPSYKTEYIPHKDVALPQIAMPFRLPAAGGEKDLKNRKTLGFWAGSLNSRIRATLAQVWHNDTELDISNSHIGTKKDGPEEYEKRFLRTKYCICPAGSQVNSARLTKSIHYGCVPVVLSDYYDLPFNTVINWGKIAVMLKEKDVYQLKQILKAIPSDEFVRLHNNIPKIQNHFLWHTPAVKYDAFNMVMYDLWTRRRVVRY